MADAESSPSATSSLRQCRLLAGLLILTAAALHIVYLVNGCPLDLAPDEAHYWDWSRHLDWSYYSKGPLVAYLIRGSCALFGTLSQQWIGSEMLAVRLPAVVCGSLLVAGLFVLTRQVYGRPRLALAVVAMALTLPPLAAGATLMTIDAPYTCCWAWAMVAGHRALFRGSAWAWPLAGCLVGLGILAKYTMVLWLLSLALFLLTSPGQRRLLGRPGFWIATMVATACCVPIVVWNSRHDWVSFRHVGGLAGLPSATGPLWLGPVVYVAGQAALFLGFWFIIWVRAMIAHRPGRATDSRVAYLWWMSAPMFVVFFLFSFKTGGGELNWPITAYISGIVLAAAWLADQLQSASRACRQRIGWGLGITTVAGLVVIVVMHDSRPVYPVLAAISGPRTERQPAPLRRLDPTCRLRGWRTLAAKVDEIRGRLRREGIEPILAGCGWSLPGELGFYCADHPMVYSLGLAMGDRWSQYDLWRPNPVMDADRFRGRTFIVVGDPAALGLAFEHIEPAEHVIHHEAGEPVARWTIVVGRLFKGFPKESLAMCGRPY
jgi:hypothetical protein